VNQTRYTGAAGGFGNGSRPGGINTVKSLAPPLMVDGVLYATAGSRRDVVALDGAAPFYRQRRVGRGGKIFHLLKIRTMVPNAEGILQDYLAQNPEARREWDRNQKLRNDPRITRLGCFLRKSSIDELPQLWNVLRGNMSLIGPRPMMLDQRARYPGTAYYHLRPGITGLWQVSDRNQSSFAERAEFDTEYYHTLSLKTDWSIFWRTISVVLRGTGY